MRKPAPSATTESAKKVEDASEADVQSDDSTTWVVVGPRKKRRRQVPTPKTSPTYQGAKEDSFFEKALHSTEDEPNNGDNNDNNSGDNNNGNKSIGNNGDDKDDNRSDSDKEEES